MAKKAERTDGGVKIEIESGVKVPQKATGPGRAYKYPFAALKPGQSFFVKDGRDPRAIAAAIGGSARSYIKNRNPKVKFTTRTMDGGVRVWRIK